MIKKIDKALEDLTYIAIDVVEDAKKNNYFDKDLAESVCIVFSMAYGRFEENKHD